MFSFKKTAVLSLCASLLMAVVAVPVHASDSLPSTDTVVEEYEFTADAKDTAHYDAPETINHDGQSYELRDVQYVLVSEPITETVTVKDLKTKKVPDTHTITTDAGKIALTLSDVEYTEVEQKETVENTIDFGYRSEAPSAPETDTQMILDYGEVTMLLKELEKAEDFAWRNVPVPATFYGTADSYGFELGDKVMPNVPGDPPWQGYEDEILSYLGKSAKNFRIVGASWLDSDFVTDENGESMRRAEFQAQMLAARWVAHYEAEVSGETLYTAQATYTNNQEGFLFKAVATYGLTSTPESAKGWSVQAVVATVLGALLIIGLVVWIMFILAKRRKEGAEEE